MAPIVAKADPTPPDRAEPAIPEQAALHGNAPRTAGRGHEINADRPNHRERPSQPGAPRHDSGFGKDHKQYVEGN